MKSLFAWVVSSSLAASMFSVFMIFISSLFKKMSSRFLYCLWIVLIIVMIIPFEVYSYLDISPLISQPEKDIYSEITDDNIIDRPIEVPAEGNYINYDPYIENLNTSAPNSHSSERTNMILNIIYYIWVAGIIAILGVNITANLVFYLKLRKSPVVENESITTLLNDLCNEMNINQKIRIIEVKFINSLSIYGVFAPVILVKSVDLLLKMDKEKQRLLLKHELQHYKSRDNLIKIISTVIKALHWFNPLVWYAFNKINIIQEYICDEKVLSPVEKEVKVLYANLLLDVYELLVPVSSFFKKPSPIKCRIQRILNYNYKSPVRLSYRVILIIFLILSTFQITNAIAKEPIKQFYGALSDSFEFNEQVDLEMMTAMGNSPAEHDEAAEVIFQDKAFESFIRKKINKLKDPVYTTDLKDIKELVIIGNTLITDDNTVFGENLDKLGYIAENGELYKFTECQKEGAITSLADLVHLPHLETLTIRYNKLSTVQGVEKLKRIMYLDLSYNSISDLKGMELLENDMRYINLACNRISDVSILKYLPTVHDMLDLSYNNISYADPVREANASRLDLTGNPILN